MKKILFLLIACSVVFVSCKKEHKVNPPVSSIQKVTFTVGFSQTTGIITNGNRLTTNSLGVNSTVDTSLSNHVNIIYYMVFDSVGNYVHSAYQTSSDTSFGHYIDNLHTGKYTVTISAGTSIQVINGGTLTTSYIYEAGSAFMSDVFFQRLAITVGNSALTQPASLNRLTSKLIVNINDAIPANATASKLYIASVGNRYNIGTDVVTSDQTGGTVASYIAAIPPSAVGTTNYRVSAIFMYYQPVSADIAVTLNSSAGSPIFGEKTIPNVTGGANEVTILSGNLFGGSGGGGVQAVPDTVWNTPIIKTFP